MIIWQLEPHSAAYNNPLEIRLHGALEVEALRRSVEQLIERQEHLRTTFEQKGDEAVQVVHPAAAFALSV
ncbi:condensation domain-containing protein, partial [Pseudomonas syringae pv. tagetis]